MTLQRFVIKTHKWLAVGVGAFTFLWFLSGIAMLLPELRTAPPASVEKKTDQPRGDAEPFRQIAIGVPQAIRAAEAAAGKALRINQVGLRDVAGKLAYEIEAEGAGVFLIDAMDGARIAITEDVAKKIAGQALGRATAWKSVSLVREYSSDYKAGPLPAWRLEADDTKQTAIYVSAETGETTSSTRRGRIRNLIVETHTFGFLRPALDNRTVNFALFGFAVAGLVMSIFGGSILLLQLQAWLRARRRMA